MSTRTESSAITTRGETRDIYIPGFYEWDYDYLLDTTVKMEKQPLEFNLMSGDIVKKLKEAIRSRLRTKRERKANFTLPGYDPERTKKNYED